MIDLVYICHMNVFCLVFRGLNDAWRGQLCWDTLDARWQRRGWWPPGG